MATAILNAMENGLVVPRESLEAAGINPGDPVIVEFRPVPSARAIQSRALRHCAQKLGEAIAVSEPRLEAGKWKVDLFSFDAVCIGSLCFDQLGELVPEESSTRQSLESTFLAGSSNHQAA